MIWVNDRHDGEEDTSHYIVTMRILLLVLHVRFSTFWPTAPGHRTMVTRDVIDLATIVFLWIIHASEAPRSVSNYASSNLGNAK